MKMKIVSFLVLNNLLVLVMTDFTAYCPKECKCMWASGSKKADCSVSDFTDIPMTVNSEIQILDLTGNKLVEIRRGGFKIVGLINLKKLMLKENNLRTIHKSGFSGLHIMIELDLSSNELITLHPDTFSEMLKIRWILLNNNQIERIEDGLFNNLPFLLKVDLSNNKIVTLGLKTFVNVPKLNILRFHSNKLQHLQVETFNNLNSLSFLDVHDNPWRCDCNLLPFKNWLIDKQLYTLPITCSEPPVVHGKLWKELNSNDFICETNIKYPINKTTIRTSNNETKNPCQLNESNLPKGSWVLNTKIKDGVYSYQGEVKYYLPEGISDTKWVNLTINLCILKYPESDKEQQVTLAIAPTVPGVTVQ